MSTDTASEPPSYDDSNEANEQILGPATLYVAGRFIHSSSGDPTAAPLYELSHSVGFLRDTDRSVQVERLDYIVKNTDGVPHLSTRKRHIFDLKHPTSATDPGFEYHAEAASRRSLCSFGISTFRPHKLRPGRAYRVHRAVGRTDLRYAPQELLFAAAAPRDRAVGYEWSDAQGRLLAREVETDELMSLVVTAEMSVAMRDALVAAWMVRVWSELAKGNYRENKWDEGESKVELESQVML
ncbi:hypothetical protein G7046_g6691 [Stylonectria norvegica]|nr:hypothetical protein G7046_g6691 [Stylonectria norvegica]